MKPDTLVMTLIVLGGAGALVSMGLVIGNESNTVSWILLGVMLGMFLLGSIIDWAISYKYSEQEDAAELEGEDD